MPGSAIRLRAESLSLTSLGDLYRDLDAYQEALDVYKQAQGIAKQLNDRFLLFYLDLAEGILNRIAGEYCQSKHVRVEYAEQKAKESESAYNLNFLRLGIGNV